LVYSILLNIPINYQDHPMNPLPAPASAPTSNSNIADCFSKPLPTTTHHRYTQLVIGDILSAPTTSVATTATVDTAATVVASATPTVVASATTATSDSVPLLHPNLDPAAPTHPIVLDTGASILIAPPASDYLGHAPFGLIRSSKATTSTLSNDPYTLITGEDTASSVDLSSPDLFDSDLFDSDSEIASAFEVLEVREFGTATLIFISYPHSELKPTILLEPIFDRFDWLDWVPLPRLTPTESYFHIFGRDYLQAFALFHLILIWIALVSLIRSE